MGISIQQATGALTSLDAAAAVLDRATFRFAVDAAPMPNGTQIREACEQARSAVKLLAKDPLFTSESVTYTRKDVSAALDRALADLSRPNPLVVDGEPRFDNVSQAARALRQLAIEFRTARGTLTRADANDRIREIFSRNSATWTQSDFSELRGYSSAAWIGQLSLPGRDGITFRDMVSNADYALSQSERSESLEFLEEYRKHWLADIDPDSWLPQNSDTMPDLERVAAAVTRIEHTMPPAELYRLLHAIEDSSRRLSSGGRDSRWAEVGDLAAHNMELLKGTTQNSLNGAPDYSELGTMRSTIESIHIVGESSIAT